MEAVEKVHKKKRKREELDKSEESGSSESKSDSDIKHRSKRVHQSSSDGDIDIALSVNHHEEILDTVSGHIQELKIKEKDMDGGDPRTSKAGAKSKKSKKKRTDSSKLGENGGEGTSLHVGDDAQMESTTDISLSGVSQESALEYLRLWKEERERWSFKKKTQYWLLQNMYDRTKVSKSGFKIMLSYLSGLQGRQRELSVQKAQKIVDQYGEEGLSSSRRHYKRAVAIMRVLG